MKNRIIIGISGKQLSGKDTFAKMLIEILGKDGILFDRIGLADALKQEYSNQKGISIKEIEQNKHLYRQDLIQLGQQRRNEDPYYWIDQVLSKEGNIIVPDVRFQNEKQAIEANGGIVIRLESRLVERKKRGKLSCIHDHSEQMLDDLSSFMFIVENNKHKNTLKDTVRDFSSLILTYVLIEQNLHRNLYNFCNDLVLSLAKLHTALKINKELRREL